MSRYRDITVAEMNPAQKRVHDQIIAGKRGRFGGPFQLLIRAPEICEYASKLGEHLRWGTSLPDRLSELAIITTARFWRAQYEWYAHAPLAEKPAFRPPRSRRSARAACRCLPPRTRR
jgi:4-carboxymuconolactone decarboxylase